MKLVIPTHRRERLPDGFAYTLWPTKVTELLKDTPQRDDSELVFHWRDELWESRWRERIQQHGTIKLVEARYTTHWSPYLPKWKINIFSVPKQYLPVAQHILLDGAMEELAQKLRAHSLTPSQEVCETICMNLADWDQPRAA